MCIRDSLHIMYIPGIYTMPTAEDRARYIDRAHSYLILPHYLNDFCNINFSNIFHYNTTT